MIEVLIIADDMTGMLDAEAQFANRGISSYAFLGDITIEDLDNCCARVAAVTTESRHLSKEKAYEKVYHIAELAKKAGVNTILKKTDSVLRGHVGAELTAVMQAAGEESILFFPAYPQQNRTTKDGVQYVGGIPIMESTSGEDKLEPVTSSFIPEILASETDVEIEVVRTKPPANWQRGEGREALAVQQNGKKQRIYVFDAENEEELHVHIVQAKTQNRIKTIAGCAGLAKELAEIMAGSAAGVRAANPNDKLFAVCGSFNRVTKSQVKYAAEQGFTYFPIGIDDLTGGTNKNIFNHRKTVTDIKEACRQKKSVIIAPAGGENALIIKDNLQLSADIVYRLNSLLMECMEELDDYTLFHTGGDTLSSFIHVSGCKKLEVCGEVLPGIAMNKLIFGQYEKYAISKSGGFGDREVLVNCINQREEGGERKII